MDSPSPAPRFNDRASHLRVICSYRLQDLRVQPRCLPLMSSHVQGDDLLLQFYLLLLQELHFPILNGIGPGMPSFMCTTAAEKYQYKLI